MTVKKAQGKYLHPEKYREFGLTVGLCTCVQENAGIPERSCEYCYGTGVSVYTNIDIPAPTNCPHWINDQIYVKGFRCSLYRDTARDIRDTTIRKEERERALDEMGLNCYGHYQMNSKRCMVCSICERCYEKRECDSQDGG